jgi:hypothetical protein
MSNNSTDFEEKEIKLSDSNLAEEADSYYNQEEDSNEGIEIPAGESRKIIWQAKDFSIREFQTMKQDGDLDLQPPYQRKFVMDIKLSSRLVESILMDVPIPVVYLAEENSGVYSIIDGQQRLTTFVSFLEGSFPDGRNFSLSGLNVLKELNKKSFADLDKDLQTKIKTTTIHSIVIKKESNEDIKFEIFERLNTGSIKLNEDEIRNSVYRGPYIQLLSELGEDAVFHKLVAKDNLKKRMIYRGMILRFFALSEKSYLNYKPSIKQFSNKELRDNRYMNENKVAEYKDKFKHCLDLVSIVFGDKAFRRYTQGEEKNKNGTWATSRINMALFDIQMCGFANYSKNEIVAHSDEIREAMIDLMANNTDFIYSILLQTSGKPQMNTRFKIWLDKIDSILKNTNNQQRNFDFRLKRGLFETDPTCAICNQQIQLIDDAEVDHILPYSKGGSTDISNAQLAHRYCNRKKSDSINNFQ